MEPFAVAAVKPSNINRVLKLGKTVFTFTNLIFLNFCVLFVVVIIYSIFYLCKMLVILHLNGSSEAK